MSTFMIYGANGYTGELTARRAVELGMAPVLAGRNEQKIRPLAEELGLPHRVFNLADAAASVAGLDGVDAVLHCAGPFSATSAPMVEACLKSKTHYLDITGEVRVFEAVYARHEEAVAAGVVLLPGVGFDVIPTDCLAATLKEKLPDATALELAFTGGAGVSPGTAKTMVEGMPQGTLVRRNGKIESLPLSSVKKTVTFMDKPRLVTAIGWGDVSSGYRSTKIPNITCYTKLPGGGGGSSVMKLLTPLVGLAPVRKFLQGRIGKSIQGPDAAARARARMHVWGRVENGAGDVVEAVMDLPEGYHFTVEGGLESVRRLLDGGVAAGAQTPSLAFGAGYITEFDDVTLKILEP